MRVEPLPFRYSSDPDRAGERYVVRIEGGWLVGFNNGEFGGALWWFSPDGKQSHRIRPTNPGAENVLGLPEVNGEHLVLMGLDHLDERSGRIFKAVQTTGDWTLQPIAVLDAEPRVWTVAGAKLVFTTKSGLWTTDGTDTHRLYQTDLGDFAPQSIVRASDGAFYLGLRYYALKLLEQDGRWVESWYVPADCQKVTLKDLACECAK